jgi:hypothetical protein
VMNFMRRAFPEVWFSVPRNLPDRPLTTEYKPALPYEPY